MSVIIRLQNLAMNAGSSDIREFFGNLQIPGGGVRIIGGKYGDAFVAFLNETEGRLALKLSGRQLCNETIYLYPSSVEEMNAVMDGKDVKPTAINVVDDQINPITNVGNTYFNEPNSNSSHVTSNFNPDPTNSNSKIYNYSYSANNSEEINTTKKIDDKILNNTNLANTSKIAVRKVRNDPRIRAKEPPTEYNLSTSKISLADESLSLLNGIINNVKKLPPGLNNTSADLNPIQPNPPNNILVESVANTFNIPINDPVKNTSNLSIPQNINEGKVLLGDGPIMNNTENNPANSFTNIQDSPNSNDLFICPNQGAFGPGSSGNFIVPMNRGAFNGPMNRGNFEGSRGRGTFTPPMNRGSFEGSGRGLLNSPINRGAFDGMGGRGAFNGPPMINRGSFDGSRGSFNNTINRGAFEGSMGRGGFDGINGKGGFEFNTNNSEFTDQGVINNRNHSKDEFNGNNEMLDSAKDDFSNKNFSGVDLPTGRGGYNEQRGRGLFDVSRGRGGFDVARGRGFDGPGGRRGFEGSGGRAGYIGARGRAGFEIARGRMDFEGLRGRGSFDRPRGRGEFDGLRGRVECEGPRGRGGFNGPRGRGEFDGPRGRGGFNGPRGRGEFDGPRGRGGFNGPRGRGGFDGLRGRGEFDGPRGRGNFNGPMDRGGFNGPRGRGGFDRASGNEFDFNCSNDNRDYIGSDGDMHMIESINNHTNKEYPNNMRKRHSEEMEPIGSSAKQVKNNDEEVIRIMNKCKEEVAKEQDSCVHIYNLPTFVRSREIHEFLGEDCAIENDGVTRLKIINNFRRSSDAYVFFDHKRLTKKALALNKKLMSKTPVYVRLCTKAEFDKVICNEKKDRNSYDKEPARDKSRNSSDRIHSRKIDSSKRHREEREQSEKYIYIRGLPADTTLTSVKSFLGDVNIVDSLTLVYVSKDESVSCVTEMTCKRDLANALRLHKTLFKTSECVSVYEITNDEYKLKMEQMKAKEILDKEIICVRVSNLHSNSNEEDIKELLKRELEIVLDKIIIAYQGKRDGLAFINVDTIEQANQITALKGLSLNDNKLDFNIVDNKEMKKYMKDKCQDSVEKKSENMRMNIRNVAYECTREEIHDLFKDYHVVDNSVYMIKNRAGKPTGEVTIDFKNLNGKRSAQIRMQNVYHRGRKLIIN